jgi:hypothetical protein
MHAWWFFDKCHAWHIWPNLVKRLWQDETLSNNGERERASGGQRCLTIDLQYLSRSVQNVVRKTEFHHIGQHWDQFVANAGNRSLTICSSGRCAECGASSRNEPLYVHHKIPISKGGNHAIDNLMRLCEKCQSLTHGGREFSYSSSEKIGSFRKLVKLINNAINNNTLIHFTYTRRDGQKSVRTIRPQVLKDVCGALCVFGYCYLRDEERTFAVRRMKSIVTVSEPVRCYYE